MTATDVLAEALKSAEQIKDRGGRAYLVEQVAVEQGRFGDPPAARKSFQAAVELYRGSSYEDVSIAIPRSMVCAGLPDDAYEFITAYGRSHPNGLERMQSLCGQYCRGTGYTKLLTKLAADTTGRSRDFHLSYLIGELAAVGKFEEAEKTLAEVTTDLWKVQALSFLAVEQQRAKDAAAARKSIRAATAILDATVMEDQRQPGKSNADLIEMRRCLATAVARTGDLKTARDIADPIRFDFFRSITLLEIVDAALAAGDVKAAIRAAESDGHAPNMDRYLLRVVDHYLQTDRHAEAATVIWRMTGVYWQALGNQSLAVAYARAGKTADAKKTLEAATALVGRDGEQLAERESKQGADPRNWFSTESREVLKQGFVRVRVAVGQTQTVLDECKRIEDARERTLALLYLARALRPPLPDEGR